MPPRKCSCGACQLCRKRVYMRDYMAEYRQTHPYRSKRKAKPPAQPIPLLRDVRPRPARLTGEMRQALREAIDQRTRERLREFAR